MEKLFDLRDKVALITGGSRGLGLQMAKALGSMDARLINIASIAGLAGNPPGLNTIAYDTSKGANINFTRAMAAEWSQYNISVNAICPGFFPSKMAAGILEKIEKTVIVMTPLHRLGGEDDFKDVAVFLASEASRHVTGQYIAVDAGVSCC